MVLCQTYSLYVAIHHTHKSTDTDLNAGVIPNCVLSFEWVHNLSLQKNPCMLRRMRVKMASNWQTQMQQTTTNISSLLTVVVSTKKKHCNYPFLCLWLPPARTWGSNISISIAFLSTFLTLCALSLQSIDFVRETAWFETWCEATVYQLNDQPFSLLH